jgi:hypothetical protein
MLPFVVAVDSRYRQRDEVPENMRMNGSDNNYSVDAISVHQVQLTHNVFNVPVDSPFTVVKTSGAVTSTVTVPKGYWTIAQLVQFIHSGSTAEAAVTTGAVATGYSTTGLGADANSYVLNYNPYTRYARISGTDAFTITDTLISRLLGFTTTPDPSGNQFSFADTSFGSTLNTDRANVSATVHNGVQPYDPNPIKRIGVVFEEANTTYSKPHHDNPHIGKAATGKVIVWIPIDSVSFGTVVQILPQEHTFPLGISASVFWKSRIYLVDGFGNPLNNQHTDWSVLFHVYPSQAR